MKYYFLCLGLLMFLFGCSSYPTAPHIQVAEELQGSFISKATKKYGVSVTGVGGAMSYDIDTVTVFFDKYKTVGIDEARQLYVDLTEDMIKEFQGKDYPPHYVKGYPFSFNNTGINLGFYNPDGSFNEEVYVVHRAYEEDSIEYLIYDENSKPNLKEIYQETYEEAKAIVAQQRASRVQPSSASN